MEELEKEENIEPAFLDIFNIKEEPVDWSEWRNENFSFEIKTNPIRGAGDPDSLLQKETDSDSSQRDQSVKRNNEQTSKVSSNVLKGNVGLQSPTQVSTRRLKSVQHKDKLRDSNNGCNNARMSTRNKENTANQGFKNSESNITVINEQLMPTDEKEIFKAVQSNDVDPNFSSICSYCNKQFLNRWNRARHEREVHKNSNKARKSKQNQCKGDFKTTTADIKSTRSISPHKSICSIDYEELESPILPPLKTYIFKCKLCGEEFDDSRSLKRHKLLLHTVAPPVRQPPPEEVCENISDNTQTNDKELGDKVSNQTEIHPEISQTSSGGKINHNLDYQNLECNVCKKTFSHRTNMIKHIMALHKGVCGICGKKFSTTLNLRNHLQKHSGKTYLCKVCGQYVSSTRNLRRHMLLHSRTNTVEYSQADKSNECNICEKQFSNQTSLTRHIELHSDSRKSCKCHICKKSFSCRGNLNRHVKKHSGKTHLCMICGKKLSNVSSLNRHIMELHNRSRVPNKCHICEKLFSNQSNLKRHLKLHSGITHSCGVCKKTFSDSSNFQKHMKLHSRSESASCDICGKSFSLSAAGSKKPCSKCSSQEANRELSNNGTEEFSWKVAFSWKTKLKTRIFKCTQCPKAFPKKSLLLKHSSTHKSKSHMTGGHRSNGQSSQDHRAKSKCPICKKSVLKLDNHLRIHSGEKKFACDFCDKIFGVVSNRNRHQRKCFTNVQVKLEEQEGDQYMDESNMTNLQSPVVLVSKLDLNEIPSIEGEQIAASSPSYTHQSIESIVHETLDSIVECVALSCDSLGTDLNAFNAVENALLDNSDRMMLANYFDFENKTTTDRMGDEVLLDASLVNKKNIPEVCLTNVELPVAVKVEIPSPGDATLPESDRTGTASPPKSFSRDKLLHMKNTLSKLKFKKIKKRNNKAHSCPHCDASFSSRASLTPHLKLHSLDRPFACDVCQRRYALEMQLERHKLTHLTDKPFKCLTCDKGFVTNSEMQRHNFNCEMLHGKKDGGSVEEDSVDSSKFECSGCGEVFAFEFSLRRHQKLNLKENECGICKVVFVCRSVFLNHQKYQCTKVLVYGDSASMNVQKEEEAPTESQDLSTAASVDGSFESHPTPSSHRTSVKKSRPPPLRIKLTEKTSRQNSPREAKSLKSPPFKSPRRKKSPTSTKITPSAERKPLNSPPSKSPASTISVSTDDGMSLRSPSLNSKSPTRSKSPASTKSPCNKTSPSNSQTLPIKSPPPLSKAAGREVSQSRMIEEFLNIQCKQCGDSFKHYNGFLNHMKMHSTDRNYECAVCLKRFHHASNLRRHCTVKHGGYTIYCKRCTKGFYSTSLRDAHTKHCQLSKEKDEEEEASSKEGRTGAKKLCRDGATSDKSKEKSAGDDTTSLKKAKQQCNVCGKQCSNKVELEAHELTHWAQNGNQNLLHTCDKCDKSFASSISLRLHARVHAEIKRNASGGGGVSPSNKSRNKNATGHLEDGTSPTSKQSFNCKICKKSFSEAYKLKYHSTAHTGEKLCRCEICDLWFSNPFTLSHHRGKTHRQKLSSVSGPPPRVIRKYEKIHEISDSTNKQLEKNTKNQRDKLCKCEYCDRQFSYPSNLSRHRKLMHHREISSSSNEPSPTAASPNEKEVSEMSEIAKNKLIKKRASSKTRSKRRTKKSFDCNICKKSFSRPSHLKYHSTIHTGEKLCRCEICDQWFSIPTALSRHRKKMHGGKPSASDENIQSMTDSTTDVLEVTKTNKETLSGPEVSSSSKQQPTAKLFDCVVCKKSFSQAHQLRYHSTIHTGEKLCRCEICDRCFSQPSGLSRHRKTMNHQKLLSSSSNLPLGTLFTAEASPKPPTTFDCEICNKSFSKAYKLRYHSTTHTGEKLSKCDICDMWFSQPTSLHKHRKKYHINQKTIHKRTYAKTAEETSKPPKKLFDCKICQKSFSKASRLKYHSTAAHTSEKLSKCEICDRLFSHPTALHQHKKTHRSSSHLCSLCGKKYLSKGNLRRHQRIRHPGMS